MTDDRLRRVDDDLGRLARTRGARVVGWCAVFGWCSFVGWQLLPYVAP